MGKISKVPINNNKIRKPKTSLSIDQKLDIIRNRDNGVTRSVLAQKYEVDPSTITHVLKINNFKNYNIRDAIFNMASAWAELSQSTLVVAGIN